MKITVITVTYNALDAFKKTFSTVVSQDYGSIEYVIIDGGSTDGTSDWLEEKRKTIESNIDFIYLCEKDNGIYDAMNKGIREALGDYCIFLNSGDSFVNSRVVSNIASTIVTNGFPDVVYGDILKEGRIVAAKKARNLHTMCYCHQGAFTSTACLREYPFDTKYWLSADFKQSKQLLMAGKRFIYAGQVIADFDTTGVSTRHRSEGLKENMKIVCELDRFPMRLLFISHLIIPFLNCKIRGR